MSDSESSDSSDDILNNSNNVTLGKSSVFEAVVWQFPNTNQCPIKDCMLSCSSRKVCLGHFHLIHADTTMLCTICNELMSVGNPLNLYRHYQDRHPNNPTPKLKPAEKTNEKITKMENRQQIDMKSYLSDGEEDQFEEDENEERMELDEEDDDDDDDAVILTGCGQICKWMWPKNLNKCQVPMCQADVKNRREAIKHFRKAHASRSLLCHLCDKPIYATSPYLYKRHFNRIHPNMKIPFDFNGKINHSTNSKSHTKKIRANSSRKIGEGNSIDSSDSEHSDSKIPDKKVNASCEDNSTLVKLKYGEWRFPDTTTCPVLGCGKQFNSRREAMDHYKKRHAMFSIFCHLCSKPIRTDVHKSGFIDHFKQLHPHKKIPYGLGKIENESTDRKSAHVEEVELSENGQDESDENVSEEDDMIVLSGCGLKFKWRFPKSTRCPVKNCRRQFGVRSDAIVHYKKFHAKRSTLCLACKEPKVVRKISDMVYHYKTIHPKQNLPSYFDASTSEKKVDNNKVKKKVITDADNDKDVDDLIVLSGCGLKFMWQFPQRTRKCAWRQCTKLFDKRSDAIDHFKINHAKRSTLCPICKVPVQMRCFGDINYHYKRKHPNVELPSCFVRKIVDADVDVNPQMERFQSNSRSENGSQPSSGMRLSCPLKFCNYSTTQMTKLCAHWTQNHNQLEFPEFRGEKQLAHAIDTQKSTIHRKVNIVLGRSNGNSTMKTSPSKPPTTVSISSESDDDDDSTNGNSALLQEKSKTSNINMHKAYRARSSIGEWFTLTSDDDDDDEEADQVQNAKKRRMSLERTPKLPLPNFNKKNDRSVSISSSSQDDSDSDHKMNGKRFKYFTDEDDSSSN